jgi:transposase
MKAGGNMAGKILMGQKEPLRGKLLEMVKQGKMTLKAAAGQMQVSYRQGIRLYRAYREGGNAALIHGSRGKRSSWRTTEETRERAVEIYRRRYSDFGPTFAAEKLAEEAGLELSVSTLRRILIAEGLWRGSGSTAVAGNCGPDLESWYSLTAAHMIGSRGVADGVASSR